MHTDEIFAWHSKHVEGVIVAQIRLYREREFAEVGKLPEVGWMHAGLVERALVVADIVVGMLERPGETFGLQRHDLVARGALGVIKFRTIDIVLRFQACRSHGT